MSDKKAIEKTLRDFVVSEFLDGDDENLTSSTNLLALGIIDSLSMVSLRVFIERTFGIRLSDAIQPESFANLSSMTDMVSQLQSENASEETS